MLTAEAFDHACAVVIIETALLINIFFARVMKSLTSQHSYIDWLELVEIWAALAVVSLFVCCTVLKILIRAVDEIRRRP